MDKNTLVKFLRSDFNPMDLYKSIRKFSGYKSWNIIKHETIGNRGLLLHIKSQSFNGGVLIVFEGDQYVVRKLTLGGFVLLMNRTKYVSTFGIILDNYLVN